MSLTLLNLQTPAQSEINAARRVATKSLARHYDAARVDRTTTDFVASVTTINRELYAGLRRMRAGSRDAARNNPYMRRFLQLLADNVIGHKGQVGQVTFGNRPGETPRPRDAQLRQSVEAAFAAWGRPRHASISTKFSWLDWQKQIIRTLARDGEMLLRFHGQGDYAFTLQQIDVAWLDETYNDSLRGGNRVLMSVEVDDYYRPQAYYLTPPIESFSYPAQLRPNQQRARVRVPARECLHLFVADEGEEQVRGVPWIHAAYVRLQREGKYEEAELIAACIEACKMGIANPPEDLSDEELAAIPDGLEESVSPGKIMINRPGWTFETFDPKRPAGMFEQFVNTVLYGVAAGLGISHASLTGNLSQVNYSSIRWGGLQERDFWRGWQTWIREHAHDEIFPRWLDAAFLAGRLEGLTVDDLRRLRVTWYPRGWAWVDPQREVSATVEAIQNQLDSRTRTVAEEGIDFADLVAELAAEQKLVEAAGLGSGAGKKDAAPQNDGEEERPNGTGK